MNKKNLDGRGLSQIKNTGDIAYGLRKSRSFDQTDARLCQRGTRATYFLYVQLYILRKCPAEGRRLAGMLRPLIS